MWALLGSGRPGRAELPDGGLAARGGRYAAGADARIAGTGDGAVRKEAVGWRDRPELSGTDLVDFLALRQVCGHPDSVVHQVGTHFVDNQRPVLPFLADGLAALIEVGHLTVDDPEPGAMRPVRVTASGRARYEDLCDRHGIAPYPPIVINGTPRQ